MGVGHEPAYSWRLNWRYAMKAIQTRYNGYLFRSRLEARWAVFFNTLGLKWEYEPEGFDLGDGVYYLPDFRVTSPQGLISWYEVKRKGHPPCEKMAKFKALHCAQAEVFGDDQDWQNTYNFQTLIGDPTDVFLSEDRLSRRNVCCRCGGIVDEIYELFDNFLVDNVPDNMAIMCWPCDMTTPSGGGHPTEKGALAKVVPYKGWIYVGIGRWQMAQIQIKIACEASRSARFEHGQSGARA